MTAWDVLFLGPFFNPLITGFADVETVLQQELDGIRTKWVLPMRTRRAVAGVSEDLTNISIRIDTQTVFLECELHTCPIDWAGKRIRVAMLALVFLNLLF